MTTTNEDLNQLSINLRIPYFRVILHETILDTRLEQGYSYILNLSEDVAENGGTHWVAISYQGQFIFYFDSFGAPPPTDVLKWMKKSRRKIAYNNVIIQALESTLCGFYCIYYLYFVNRVQTKKTLHERSNEFISKFSYDPDVNASLLRNGLSLILKLHTLPKRIYMALMQKIKYT